MGKRQSILQAANIIAGLATIIVNSLAGTGLINNIQTGEVSDLYPNLITPAGLTFAIWGVIYALVVVYLIVQTKGIRKGDAPDFVDKIGPYFLITCIANIAWIFVWQYKFITWSLVPMVLLLLSLIEIYTRLGIGKTTPSRRERYGVHLLFSVYLGWITVATIANVTVYLVAIGWNGFGLTEATWFGIIVAIATIVALLVIWTRRDLAYMLVFVWAYIGIIIKRMQPDPQYSAQPVLAAYTAVMLVIIIFAYIIRLIADRPSKTIPRKQETTEEPMESTAPAEQSPAITPPPSPESPTNPQP
jgi:benzodiazapine receptor